MIKPRMATIRLDRVQPGMVYSETIYGKDRPYPADDATVLTSAASGLGLWRITWAGGSLQSAREALVRVQDPSGLIQLKEDVEVYGPFVCTSGKPDEPGTAGTIHFANLRLSGAPAIVDLIIRQGDATVLTLKNVELGHIEQMARELRHQAQTDPKTPAFHGTFRGGCGQYHPKGECPNADSAA